MSREDDERMWNLLICKCYATDKEMEDMAPFILIAVVILVIIFCVASCWEKKKVPTETVPPEQVEKVEIC